MNKIERIRELTTKLNGYRNEYYNLNAPSVTDAEYDRLFDELLALETETGFISSNSPTQTVGYAVVSNLEKTMHNIPLLSLPKTKSIDELKKFTDGRQMLMMLKFDGLTVKLTYEGGKLIEAATRGDGETGEIITHNAQTFNGVPMQIPVKDKVVITGEAFIHLDDFEYLQKELTDSNGDTYKTSRNLASGSVRLLDAGACKERRISFSPFNVLERHDENGSDVKSKTENLMWLQSLGFEMYNSYCPVFIIDEKDTQDTIEAMTRVAKDKYIPIDGLVFTFDNIEYSKSLGRTGHHFKDGMAFKFEDEAVETTLREIRWNTGRTGEIAPVAIFDTISIDGTDVTRATLHNLSFIRDLELMPGCRILVSKRNMIIPHIEDNLDRGNFDADVVFPQTCPCCHKPTRVHISTADKSRKTETLHCDNEDCEARKLRALAHFVSKKAMNIEGLSEATLEKFIDYGWLSGPEDIYCLDERREQIIQMEGFGEKSYLRLWSAIEESKNTTFERYIIAMDIPMIGNNASRTLAERFDRRLDFFYQAVDAGFDFSHLTDIGPTLNKNIYEWFEIPKNKKLFEDLQKIMNFRKKEVKVMEKNSVFTGKTIVVTGKVEPYTRDGINAVILSLGAHPGSSVSKKTDYLICGENAGSKLTKAQDLGVTVLTPEEFSQMANN